MTKYFIVTTGELVSGEKKKEGKKLMSVTHADGRIQKIDRSLLMAAKWDAFRTWEPVMDAYFSNAERFIFSVTKHGLTEIAVSPTIAQSFDRTGNSRRDLHAWANIEEVKINNMLCELYYYDRNEAIVLKAQTRFH